MLMRLSIKQTISLDELGHIQTIQYNDMKFTRDPQLSDYYNPSDDMKEYQMVFIGLVGLGSRYIVHNTI